MRISRLLVLAALSGCMSVHHRSSDGNTTVNTGDTFRTVAIMDAEGRNAVLGKATSAMPVSVTTTIVDGRRSTTETVSAGYPAYGMPVGYGVASNPALARLAAEAEVERARYMAANGMLPVSGPVPVPAPNGVSAVGGAGTIPASQVILDQNVPCPEIGANTRRAANVAEKAACDAIFQKSVAARMVK